jgi:hypothetical protein
VPACAATLTYENPYESYRCSLEQGHTYPDGTPSNHECWRQGELMAEWAEKTHGSV